MSEIIPLGTDGLAVRYSDGKHMVEVTMYERDNFRSIANRDVHRTIRTVATATGVPMGVLAMEDSLPDGRRAYASSWVRLGTVRR